MVARSLVLGLALCLLLLACAEDVPGGSTQSGGEYVTQTGDPLPDDATLSEILGHPDALLRAHRVAELLRRSGPEDLREIRLAFERAPLERGDTEYGLFGYWWATFNPKAAYVYADQVLRMDHGGVIVSIIRAWAERDPLGALESGLLNSVTSQQPGLQEQFVGVFVTGWFDSGQPGLEDWIVTQSNPRDVANGLKAYARMRVLRDGAEETLEWTRTAPFEPLDRRLLIAGAVNTIAHEDPELASQWVEVAKGDGVDTRTFIPRIARSWAHHSPKDALDWVLTQPEGRERDAALNRIAGRWVRRDQDSMLTWLDGHIGEEWTDVFRNQGVRFHVTQNNYQVDWDAVVRRAFDMTDERKRDSLGAWVLQRWYVADQPAAEAWIAANPDALPAVSMERAKQMAPRARQEIVDALARKRAREAAASGDAASS